MELASEAARSRHLPEFLHGFSQRVTRMLGAKWCGVVVLTGQKAELYSAEPAEKRGLDEAAIVSFARKAGNQKEICVMEEIRLATSGGRSELIVIPVRASGGEPLGAICVYAERTEAIRDDQQLLHALASHAALSLENFLRFSQLERSKRQWVQDIDAISDFIVVHDRAWKIVRTNRSLADYLGMPPVALVGEAVSSLRQLARGEGSLPCPFCLDAGLNKEEHIVTSAEKIYIVSTSRATGITEDDTRTIHVLKDITDRREAERRYRRAPIPLHSAAPSAGDRS